MEGASKCPAALRFFHSRADLANCIKIQHNVTDRITLPVNQIPANHRRLLGYLMLVIIAYGAIIETAHSHRTVLPNHSSVAAVSETDGPHAPPTGHSQQNQCSMCQFQQQLFSGLVQTLPFALAPSTEFAFVPSSVIDYQQNSTPPTSGRGPPLASRL